MKLSSNSIKSLIRGIIFGALTGLWLGVLVSFIAVNIPPLSFPLNEHGGLPFFIMISLMVSPVFAVIFAIIGGMLHQKKKIGICFKVSSICGPIVVISTVLLFGAFSCFRDLVELFIALYMDYTAPH